MLTIVAAAVVASAALLPRLEFDFNPMHLRSESTESVATLLDLMRDPDTTPNTLDVLAPSVSDAVAFAQRAERLPEVDHAITLASFVPGQQDEKLAALGDAALLLDPVLNPGVVAPSPSDRAVVVDSMNATAQQLDAFAAASPASTGAIQSRAESRGSASRLAKVLRVLAQGERAQRERAAGIMIPGLVVMLEQLRAAVQAQAVTLDALPRDLVRDWVAADGRARIEIYPKAGADDNEGLRRFVAAVRAIAPDATGMPASIQESSKTIVGAFVEAGVWALAAISLLLAITLRRAVDVVLTLAPLMVAAIVTLGICAAIGMALNFENIIALPLLIGIGVAFNIYYVMAWRNGAVNLLQSTLTRAILFSALTTGTAFGSLWLSRHPGTASMGKLLALSLACTLIAALLFLPSLLASVRSRRAPSR